VRVIPNISFGEPTTVAGLLTGRCFLAGVQPAEADLLMVSPSTLRYGTETMLDEITLSDLRERLNMDVQAGGKNLGELARAILDHATLSGDGLQHAANRINLPQFGKSAHALKETT
jgi:NifB/MoaA-like Fe-S oxidoreductase